MQLIIIILHVLLAIALVALVLIQQGKGAEAGAAFGGGASQTVFGSRGSSSFLAKFTGVLAALFFITALGLGWWANHMSNQGQMSGLPSSSMIQEQHNSVSTPNNSSQAQGSKAATASSASDSNTAARTSASQSENKQSSDATQATPTLDGGQSSVDNAAPSTKGNTTP